jgi:hypothetical protein
MVPALLKFHWYPKLTSAVLRQEAREFKARTAIRVAQSALRSHRAIERIAKSGALLERVRSALAAIPPA